jgi:hypothetical protein
MIHHGNYPFELLAIGTNNNKKIRKFIYLDNSGEFQSDPTLDGDGRRIIGDIWTTRHIELEEGKKWLCEGAAIFFFFLGPFVASSGKENARGFFYYFCCKKASPAILLILGFDRDRLAIMHHY